MEGITRGNTSGEGGYSPGGVCGGVCVCVGGGGGGGGVWRDFSGHQYIYVHTSSLSFKREHIIDYYHYIFQAETTSERRKK